MQDDTHPTRPASSGTPSLPLDRPCDKAQSIPQAPSASFPSDPSSSPKPPNPDTYSCDLEMRSPIPPAVVQSMPARVAYHPTSSQPDSPTPPAARIYSLDAPASH